MRIGVETGGLTLYDCTACAETPHLYAALGHDGPPTDYFDKNLVTGEELTRCPLRTQLLIQQENPALYREFRRMLTYFAHYERGFLLHEGGLIDQPARYVEWMTAFREMKERVQKMYDQREEIAAREQERALADDARQLAEIRAAGERNERTRLPVMPPNAVS